MAVDKVKLELLAIGFLGMILIFVVVFHILNEKRIEEELRPKTEVEEAPLSPGHEETVYIGHSIPFEERQRIEKKRKEAEQGESIPFGTLNWKPKRTKKKEKPEEQLSTYEKEGRVVKPDSPDGSAVR